MTDAQGRAQTVWTLGTRAGAGKNRVEATSPGIAGVAVFTATGLPAAGAQVNVDAGNLQFGVAGQDLPRPLVAVLTDAGHNRLPGVPLTFRSSRGAAASPARRPATVETDAYGRALAALTLGPDAGEDNNLVEASFAGNPGGPGRLRGLRPGGRRSGRHPHPRRGARQQRPADPRRDASRSRTPPLPPRPTRKDSSPSPARRSGACGWSWTARPPSARAPGRASSTRWSPSPAATTTSACRSTCCRSTWRTASSSTRPTAAR